MTSLNDMLEDLFYKNYISGGSDLFKVIQDYHNAINIDFRNPIYKKYLCVVYNIENDEENVIQLHYLDQIQNIDIHTKIIRFSGGNIFFRNEIKIDILGI